MRRYRILSFWAGIGTFFSLIDPVFATPQGSTLFKETYPGKPAPYYNCAICHTGKIGKKGPENLNPYGQSLKWTPPEKLTVEQLKSAEPLDPDEDSIPSGEEINTGTAPGDPASTPPKKSGETSRRTSDTLGQMQSYVAGWAVSPAEANTEKETAAKSDAEAPKAEYVGMETCASCHTKEAVEFKHSTHARISIPEQLGAEGCEMCHGPGSLHVEAGGGRGVGGIINPRKDPKTCFQCHLDKKAEFNLPYHHPVTEGKVSCADCHNAHGAEVRPWSSTSLKDINEACFKCHKDQRGPFVWEHEGVREGCTTCHKVHGSIHQKMLLARDNNLCLRCHTQTDFPVMGRRSHSSYLVPGRSCWSGGCHTAPHGSNFDDHLRY